MFKKFTRAKRFSVRLIIGDSTDNIWLSNIEHFDLNPKMSRPNIGEKVIVGGDGPGGTWEIHGRVIDVTANYVLNRIDIWAAKQPL